MRTLISQTLLCLAVLAVGAAVQAAPISTGSVFEPHERAIRYGVDGRAFYDESRVNEGRRAGRNYGGLGRGVAPGGEVAVPEPSAALLFGLGALVVALRRRR